LEVDRVRGINILSVSLIAMLLGFMVVGTAKAPETATVIYVQPNLITAMPGDTIIVAVMIEHASGVTAWEIRMSYAPFVKTLKVVSFTEGPFMQMNPQGYPTVLAKYVDVFHGELAVGVTIINQYPGELVTGSSGSGALVYIEFIVTEAGESPLDLHDTKLIDSDGMQMNHQVRDGYYLGPTANLVNKNAVGRTVKLGDTQVLYSSAKNLATVPLYIRTMWRMTRDDGATFTMYSGQRTFAIPPRPAEYLYVNGYEAYLDGWTKVGASPWLNAVGDGNYIEATDNGVNQGKFTFQDVVVGTSTVASVSIEAYTFGPYDDTNDFDAYAREPLTEAAPTSWLGSLYSGGSPGWQGLRWVDTQDISTIFASLRTQAGINNFKLRYVSFYTGDGLPRPAAGIDAIRLKVEFAGGLVTEYSGNAFELIQPNEVLNLSPYTWETSDAALGKYYTTCILQYKYYDPSNPTNPSHWIDAQKSSAFAWTVVP
jgi:hypothetical protein